MQYLVQMKLVAPARPATAEQGAAFIEQIIFPTLELGKQLHAEGRIVAGGPMSGTIGLAFIVKAENAEELDGLITSLPVWPRMETEVTPLSTFDARAQALRPRLEQKMG
jgi:muconolactone delta-isomerase